MLVALGLWPMSAEDAARTPGLRQAPARRLHDREGRARNHPRVHAQRQPLPPGGHDGQESRASLPARTLGGRPGQSRSAAALYPLGQAGLRRLHVRHGRLQRQQAVHPRVPQRSPPALGPQPGHAPDLEQHPGPRLADLPSRRGSRADRLHGRIGRRHPDVPAHGPRRPDHGRRAGRHGLRLVPGRLRLRERRRAAPWAPTTSSSPPCAPRAR